jgi:hypothetical protein
VPLPPVTVNGYVPGVRPWLVLTVSVEVEAVDEGANVAVAPDGRPLAERATDPLKPPLGETVTV